MTDNEKAPIDFWFDFSSPYGYLLAEKSTMSRQNTAARCAGTRSCSASSSRPPAAARRSMATARRRNTSSTISTVRPASWAFRTTRPAASRCRRRTPPAPTTGCTVRIAHWPGNSPRPSIAAFSLKISTFHRPTPCSTLRQKLALTAAALKLLRCRRPKSKARLKDECDRALAAGVFRLAARDRRRRALLRRRPPAADRALAGNGWLLSRFCQHDETTLRLLRLECRPQPDLPHRGRESLAACSPPAASSWSTAPATSA